MTIQELIDRLMESGDETFRKTATIRIADVGGNVIEDNLTVFDVKNAGNRVEIRLPQKKSQYMTAYYSDEEWE